MKRKTDAERHRYAIMIDGHRQEWAKFCKNTFDKPFKADRTAVKKIFAATSSPEAAEKQIKSYFKGPAKAGWLDALKKAWVETGKASLTYIHAFHTGKSAYTEESIYKEAYLVSYSMDLNAWRYLKDEELPVLKQDVEELHSAWDQFVADKIKTSFQGKITDITSTTEDKIHNLISQGISNGDGHYTIGQSIDDALDNSWEGRGMTISRTEANSAMNAAILEDGKATVPDLWKTWSTTGMDNVREWHQEADGQSVPMDESFEVMGEALDMPGDDSGSPENVVNCACTILFEPGPEGETPPPTEESIPEEGG